MKDVMPTIKGRKAERALRETVARVMERSQRLGLPVAVMKNGRAVLIPAERAVAMVKEERAVYETRTRTLRNA